MTCGVSRFDLGLQLQRDARHLFVGGVASAAPLGFLGGVAFEVDERDQAVAAGLRAACGRHSSSQRLLLLTGINSAGCSLLCLWNLHWTHLDPASVLCLPSCHSASGAGDIWRF